MYTVSKTSQTSSIVTRRKTNQF